MREIESFLFLLKDVKRTSCNGVFQVVSAIIGGSTVYLVTGNQCCFVPEMDVWIWQYEQTRTVGFSFPQLPVCIKRRAGHRTAYFSSCGTVPADRVCSFYGGHAGEIGNGSFHCHDASYDMRICSVPFIAVTGTLRVCKIINPFFYWDMRQALGSYVNFNFGGHAIGKMKLRSVSS